MAETAAEQTIIITRVLRDAADRMMEQAYKDRDAGKLPLESFFVVAERYQQIQNECNRAVHEAASKLEKFPAELQVIARATEQLESTLKTISAVSDTVNLSAKLLWALGSLVLTIVTPSLEGAGVTASAIVDVGRTIVDIANR